MCQKCGDVFRAPVGVDILGAVFGRSAERSLQISFESLYDGTLDRLPGVLDAIEGLRRSDDATLRWGRFKRQAYYAGDARWQDVLDSVEALLQAAIP